jgi:hypothetical protein
MGLLDWWRERRRDSPTAREPEGFQWGPEKHASGYGGPRHRHPVLGMPEGRTHSHPGAMTRHWHKGDAETDSIGLGPKLGRFETVGSYYRKRERATRRVLKTKPVFVRHVAFQSDGKGATFELHKLGDRAEWIWTLDVGLDPDLALFSTPYELAKLEKELGMPITYPFADPDRRSDDEGRGPHEF